jgi:lipoate-protein ligase A
MYALVLGYGIRGYGPPPARQIQQLPDINATHQFVLERMAQSLSTLTPNIVRTGISDLAIPVAYPQGGETRLHKFSGNSLRCKRTHLLYHGTLLYDFDLPRISRWLKMPPRHPEYRSARSHEQFVTNLPVPGDQMVQALIRGWQAGRPLDDWPRERTARLTREKYHLEDVSGECHNP